MKKLLIILSLLFYQVSFAQVEITDAVTTCTSWTETMAELVRDVASPNFGSERHVKICACHELIASKTDYGFYQELPSDVMSALSTYGFTDIPNFLEKLNNDCTNVYYNPSTRMACYFNQSSFSHLSLEEFKALDSNKNCTFDTKNEKCENQLKKELHEKPTLTTRRIQGENYGCYSEKESPMTLKENIQNLDPSSNIQVLDINKGLISNRKQQSVLQNIIQTEQGGPIVGLINFVIDYLVSIVFVLCMASLIYGGYNLMFAGLDSEMVEKGKNAIKYAIFGFVFIMLSYTIVILVQSLL